MMESKKKEAPIKGRGLFAVIRARGRTVLLLCGALLGLLLLLFGGGTDRKSTASDDEADVLATGSERLACYESALERELEALCEAVSGVSDATVMVSFESGYSVHYEKDGDGDPTVVGSGSYAEALYDTVKPPTVAGVGIVCRGGNDPVPCRTLTELVSTTLGIPSSRVFITGK